MMSIYYILTALEFALILILTGALTYVIHKKKANTGKFQMPVNAYFHLHCVRE